MEHKPYTDETIKRAITEGVEPDGESLDWPMPLPSGVEPLGGGASTKLCKVATDTG
jgi:hypothetical protein